MPKARKRKQSTFDNSPSKSVFLFGNPNKAKRLLLHDIQQRYVAMVNDDIKALSLIPGIHMQLIKNDKKDSYIRKLEKQLRPTGVNSAFCQNAFDCAFTKLANRLDSIRLDMFQDLDNLFCKSKVLFALCLEHCTKSEMIQYLKKLMLVTKKDASFYIDCANTLANMSESDFSMAMLEFQEFYEMVSLQYKIPFIKSEAVPFDSRLMKIELSDSKKMPYVITMTDPFCKNYRFSVPVGTSKHSLHKIASNKMAGTVTIKQQGNKLRVGWSYKKQFKTPSANVPLGVDTGIKDAFFISDGRSIGSMKGVIDFYHKEVEPAFAQMSNLRNKKKKIKHYIQKHKNLSEDVRRSLIQKIDTLDHMLQTMQAPYRKKHTYYNMLDHEIRKDVKAYISSIESDTLTVLELLDIKEFNKSRKLNGDLSTFARGKLQKKLMTELNWKGYGYVEVPPDFTSQTCPICGYRCSENRSKENSKVFKCGCCGYSDDADHVGALNIQSRATDTELLDIWNKAKGHEAKQRALIKLLDKRHLDWLESNQTPILLETEKAISLTA